MGNNMEQITHEKLEELSKFAEWLVDQGYHCKGPGLWIKGGGLSDRTIVASTTHQIVKEYYKNGKPNERRNSIKG
jgi:hypothetical protein